MQIIDNCAHLTEVTREYYTVMRPWADPLLSHRLHAIAKNRGWLHTEDFTERMDEVWEELKGGLASIWNKGHKVSTARWWDVIGAGDGVHVGLGDQALHGFGCRIHGRLMDSKAHEVLRENYTQQRELETWQRFPRQLLVVVKQWGI